MPLCSVQTLLRNGWVRFGLFLFVFCPMSAVTARAHEVHHDVIQVPALVLRLTYADGEPFSYESFEVYAAGSQRPFALGRTDAEGRAVFLPPATGELQLKAYSADGHGVDVRFTPPLLETGANENAKVIEDGRAAKLMFGAGILLALFGLAQLLLHRRGSP